MNIVQLFQMVNGNPQMLLERFVNSNPEVSQNPIARNAINMVRNNDISGLQSMARNLYQERGLDVDQAYRQISSMMKYNRH